MPDAEIIAIGTELLLGEIQDTNTRYLARHLRDLGVNIYRATLVGDNAERIAQVIREAMQRCQIIITTGGLGPTVDDPTRAAVAMALGVETRFHPELWEQIQAHSNISEEQCRVIIAGRPGYRQGPFRWKTRSAPPLHLFVKPLAPALSAFRVFHAKWNTLLKM
jgi:molybdenum cofactor synthesis domain-containing protein